MSGNCSSVDGEHAVAVPVDWHIRNAPPPQAMALGGCSRDAANHSRAAAQQIEGALSATATKHEHVSGISLSRARIKAQTNPRHASRDQTVAGFHR